MPTRMSSGRNAAPTWLNLKVSSVATGPCTTTRALRATKSTTSERTCRPTPPRLVPRTRSTRRADRPAPVPAWSGIARGSVAEVAQCGAVNEANYDDKQQDAHGTDKGG